MQRARRPLITAHTAIRSMLVAGALVGCATTVDEPSSDGQPDGVELADSDTTPLSSGVIVDEVTPPTTEPVVGSASELLPEIGVDLSRLSAQIGDEGDEDATLARIQANWAAIKDEIERDRPELLNSIQATIDMATTAVERNRPADADKAFSLMNDLIDSFTGDG